MCERRQGESRPPSQPTALLLGASRGLGLGLAREYLSRGWRVIATARSDAAKLEALEKSAKGNLRIEHVDIADTDGVAELREALEGRKARPAVSRRRHFRARCRSRCTRSRPTRPRACILTNAYFPIAAAEAFADLLKPKATRRVHVVDARQHRRQRRRLDGRPTA